MCGKAQAASNRGAHPSRVVDQAGFTLGAPALVCRWRLTNRALPLKNRHMRALAARRIDGRLLTPELVAWVKQHVEWTLEGGAADYPDGVLMLVVDERGKAALSVGPYAPLRAITLSPLAKRAVTAMAEGRRTGVPPEVMWVVRDGRLVAGLDAGTKANGTSTLVSNLADTLGIPWTREQDLAKRLVAEPKRVGFDEAFFVSDEHGILVPTNAEGPRARRLADGYLKLLASQGSHR